MSVGERDQGDVLLDIGDEHVVTLAVVAVGAQRLQVAFAVDERRQILAVLLPYGNGDDVIGLETRLGCGPAAMPTAVAVALHNDLSVSSSENSRFFFVVFKSSGIKEHCRNVLLISFSFYAIFK